MKIPFILSLLLLVCVELRSQDYAVTHIPAELKKNASVVKRMDEVRFEITEKNKATYYQKVAFTILDEKGDRWAAFAMGYDKLRSIESFDGSLFDANGKK